MHIEHTHAATPDHSKDGLSFHAIIVVLRLPKLNELVFRDVSLHLFFADKVKRTMIITASGSSGGVCVCVRCDGVRSVSCAYTLYINLRGLTSPNLDAYSDKSRVFKLRRPMFGAPEHGTKSHDTIKSHMTKVHVHIIYQQCKYALHIIYM